MAGSPTFNYRNVYSLKSLGGGSYSIFSYGTHPDQGSITDISDGPTDNLAVLGDISNDHFETGGDTVSDYVGQSGGGIIGSHTDQSGNTVFHLYTNAAYTYGNKIAASDTPFALPCFASGTLIDGARGEVAVETLCVGDVLLTAAGAERPVRWLGHRTIDCRNHPRPRDVMPVRIAAHALGENKPARDLVVSPGHAICVDVVDEVLIPAIALVNGATIRQIDVDEVTYWHVELDSHDIILAENLPAESFLDMGNRGFFKEANLVDLAAAPDADASLLTHADFCRPFHAAGPLVDVVRAQLARRAEAAGWSQATAVEMHLEVDGQRVDPAIRGRTARFRVPAGAKEVWLVSPTSRPFDNLGSGDTRDLGLCIAALRIDDGFDVRDVAIDDPVLCVGFHELEDASRRWTSGRAKLPAALWAGGEEAFYLRVELAGLPVPRWIAPANVTPRLVAAA